MTHAATIIAEARSGLSEADNAIRGHAYVSAIEEGRLDSSALLAFFGNQYQMWKRNPDSAALSMARFAGHPYREIFLTDPAVELQAGEELANLAAKLGMDRETLDRFEPSAAAFGYAAYRAWLICYGSASEITCARALNLSAWGHNCGMISRGLRTHYGLSSTDTGFLDSFDALQTLEEDARAVIDEDLRNGIEPYVIIRAARMMQDYERMFWDEMARLAGLTGWRRDTA